VKTLGERTNGLRWRLRATRRLWGPGARPEMPFLAPLPVLANGEIDGPGPGLPLPEKLLTVSGWAAFKSGPTARVEVWLGEHSLGLARLGLARPDLGGGDLAPHAASSGFALTTELDHRHGGEGALMLRVLATATNGETFEIEPIETLPPVPPKSPEQTLRPITPIDPSPRGNGKRVLIFTHQLNLGGAQLYLHDLLRQLHEQSAIDPVVVSAMDGVLREELEDMGIPVHITSPIPYDDLSAHLGRIEEFLTWARPYGFEMVFVNTATTHAVAGAELGERLGIPVGLAIHESFPPEILWGAFDPTVLELTERGVSRASFAVFEADATKRLYEPALGPGAAVTLPYGLDLAPIERERERFDLVATRREAGLPDDAEVILCVGTIEPRKAQVSLAIAFDLIAIRHPKAHLVFVGGRKNADSFALRDRIEASPWRERIRLEPITPDVLPWYALADLLVCASDIESLPRTVLEAMALETPVLATEVFGLPELITDGKTGWLCRARDISALAEALSKILNTPLDERAEVAKAARFLVEDRHDLPRYANQISKLLDAATEGATDEPKRRINSA
jgi:D-inositol-3-phosphate glycosyltransferase